MAEERNGSEEPTQRRRDDARNDGQTVNSPDLTAALSLLAACGVLFLTGQALGARLMNAVRDWIVDVPSSDWGTWHVIAGSHWLGYETILSCTPIVVAVMAVGLVISFLQVGFVISTKPLEIDFAKLLPSAGWERVFSMESGIRGLQGAVKVTLLTLVAVGMLWVKRDHLSVYQYSTVSQVVASAWRIGLMVCLIMGGTTLALALTDYLIRWFRSEQKLKMTREEIKQEQKDDTGDPHMKAAIRKKQRDARKQQSVKDVPKATVVLTNPTHLAIAIRYEAGMLAPKIMAKGAGVFAKNIVRIAKEHKIPVIERKPLARALYANVEVGQEIPFEFFRAVAEIIAQIYRARQAA
ncbi:MAG: flagellar biosynthesis protein FlhB [Planctomyces sp.]|jgi:flagellar biosynthetic protein FlhB